MDGTHVIDNGFDTNAGRLRASFARFKLVDRLLGQYPPGKVVKLMTFLICVYFLIIGAIIKYGDLLNAQWSACVGFIDSPKASVSNQKQQL
jgi:hypothetical protein